MSQDRFQAVAGGGAQCGIKIHKGREPGTTTVAKAAFKTWSRSAFLSRGICLTVPCFRFLFVSSRSTSGFPLCRYFTLNLYDLRCANSWIPTRWVRIVAVSPLFRSPACPSYVMCICKPSPRLNTPQSFLTTIPFNCLYSISPLPSSIKSLVTNFVPLLNQLYYRSSIITKNNKNTLRNKTIFLIVRPTLQL